MIDLLPEQICLAGTPQTKADAITQVGELLVESGCIEPGYVASMFHREQVANTFLGSGIAIPHGMPQDRALIKRTGIAILQVPAGVSWNEGETAHLIVGIAASSGEHIDVLRRLTRVLADEEQVTHLIHTTEVDDIIAALTGQRPERAPASAADYALVFSLSLPNPSGLHARPAANFVNLAKQFRANVRVRHNQQAVDGKSLLALLQLGARQGTLLHVSAEGEDAADALKALQAAMEAGLGDEPEAVSAPAPIRLEAHEWAPKEVKATIAGISAASGLAIGVVRQHHTQLFTVEDSVAAEPTVEAARLSAALEAARAELRELYEEVKGRFGLSKAAIFLAHEEFLNDASLIEETTATIAEGHTAAWAWHKHIQQRVTQVEKLDDPVLASRAVDLSDVGQRVLRHLLGVAAERPVTPDTPVILIADDLRPSDTAALNTEVILGFCTAGGGPTSHTAIIAKSLGIPALVAAGEIILGIPNGTACILDGYTGRLYLEPSPPDVLAAREVQNTLQIAQAAANTTRLEPAITLDGHRVEVAANINRAAEAPQAIESGAEAVGLMRTEFLFLESDHAPSEEEQFEAYRDMVQALEGRPLIIRTLDIGGDKEVPYLNLPREDNSFLGIRGIRLCLARPDLFVPQLRAIYRAAAFGPIKIMFPMIATLDDFQNARAVAEQVRQELNAPLVDLGIMVEVPSAALLAEHLAPEVAFFSVGTNDLTQYTLAMDRLHPQLAKQADGLHPTVLRLISMTVAAAQRAGKWVGVCGGLAGDPKGALILVGLGVKELSVARPSIPAIKAVLRQHTLAELQALAQKALACATAAEVRAL